MYSIEDLYLLGVGEQRVYSFVTEIGDHPSTSVRVLDYLWRDTVPVECCGIVGQGVTLVTRRYRTAEVTRRC